MRDLMVLGAMFFLVPLALSNAFAAYLVWGWTAVIAVPNYLYGFMGSLRYNLFFAAITLSLVLIGRVKDKGEFKLNRTSALIILFTVHGAFCAAFAYPEAIFNALIYTDFLKSVTFCLTMFLFVNSRLRLHAMLVMLALGLGFHGGVEGLKTLVTGGGHKILGIPGSKMSDNNHFGVAIVMVLPILLYLYQYSQRQVIRYGFLALTGLTVLSVVGSNSRGAFVAMAAIAAVLMVTSRRKVLSFVAVSIGLGLVLILSPASWFERIETIGNAGEDSSFMGRVEAWNICSAVALEHPFVGGGFHAMQSQYVWQSVRPSAGLLSAWAPTVQSDIARAAHSIYFEVLGDMGFVGLFIFLAIVLNTFVTARAIKKMVVRHGKSLFWARDMADALSLSCLAYAVGGAAVSLAYFETFYVVAVLLETLKIVVAKEVKKQQSLSPIGGETNTVGLGRMGTQLR